MCAVFFLTFPLVFSPPSLPISPSAVTLGCHRVKTSTLDLPVVRLAWSRLSLRRSRVPPTHPVNGIQPMVAMVTPTPRPPPPSPAPPPAPLPPESVQSDLVYRVPFPCRISCSGWNQFLRSLAGPRDGDEGSGLSGNDVQSGSRQRTCVDAPQTRLCGPRRGNIRL